MSLELGRVAAVHEDDNSVDLVMVKDGSHLAGVQVMSWAGTTRSGHTDLATPTTPPGGDKWDLTNRTDCDMIAVVGYVDRQPLVMGFLFPQICQMLFDRRNFAVDRHPSDFYRTIDDKGNFEAYHPSGTFVRIAEDPEHEDLTAEDVDENWKIDRNTTRAPWVSVLVRNGGNEVARVRIDPSGNVTLDHDGNLTSHTGGNASVDVDGNASVNVDGTTSLTSGGNATITAPNLTVNVAGAVAITSASLTHNGKNVGSTHTHSGVTAGPSNTGAPT